MRDNLVQVKDPKRVGVESKMVLCIIRKVANKLMSETCEYPLGLDIYYIM